MDFQRGVEIMVGVKNEKDSIRLPIKFGLRYF